ncbi:hypothetical protein AB4Z27_27800 [Cupriavidus sp. KB_39]|uniref:hypothetical protein n=1 Tax=Cupriavidus sp. KB_39 TaxID=3233036 RepID=UPI003F8FC97C
MYQIDNSTAAAAQPASTAAGTAGFFTDGNPAGGVPATIVPAEWLNAMMMELVNVVLAGGLTLSKSNFTQVRDAIRAIGKVRGTLTDTGAANAYAAANPTPLVAGTWADGVVQYVKIANANTGPSTYSPDGLPAIPIYGLGLSALQGAELRAGCVATLVKATIAGVNSGNPICVLVDCQGAPLQISPSTQSGHAVNQSQVIGIAQTQQNVTASRAIGTTYTNSTGKPIFIEVQLQLASGQGMNFQKNGANVQAFGNGGSGSGGFTTASIVPAGYTYGVTATPGATLIGWYETRA